MALAIGVLFLAGGSTLIWGVDGNVAGVDLSRIGWIGLAIGIAVVTLEPARKVRARLPFPRTARYGGRSR